MERSAVGRRHERDKRRLSASQAVAPGGATVSLSVEQNGFEVLRAGTVIKIRAIFFVS
jgi:hypothetical protein